MIDYKLLEAFAMVILEGGFEKAARKLHITQSAVSQRLKLLEEDYGQVLIQRTSPPQPTAYGKGLLAHYRQVKHLEDDLNREYQKGDQVAYASIAIAVNADTLATWFFEAVQPLIEQNQLVLDLFVDDQEETHKLMKEGKVWGCITTRSKPLQGCQAVYLGSVRYGIFSTPDFAERWFKHGCTIEAFEHAPAARFNRKDDLNNKMFQILFQQEPQNPPTFFIPSTEVYAEFVQSGFCYGILPEQQSDPLVQKGTVINLSPSHSVEVNLYWHCWNLKSKDMKQFSLDFTKNVTSILPSAP